MDFMPHVFYLTARQASGDLGMTAGWYWLTPEPYGRPDELPHGPYLSAYDAHRYARMVFAIH